MSLLMLQAVLESAGLHRPLKKALSGSFVSGHESTGAASRLESAGASAPTSSFSDLLIFSAAC
jgi:hypothetical protein